MLWPIVGVRPGVINRVSTLLHPPSPPIIYTRLLHRSFCAVHNTSPLSLLRKQFLELTRGRHVQVPVYKPIIHKILTRSAHVNMEPNGHPRQKRKGSPVNNHDRPAKVLRPQRSETINSDDSQYMYGSDSIADAMVEPPVATADTAEWQATIEQVVRNVVSIHFAQTCSFDTSSALSSEATGFVVDAARGYILTNRHVVGSGPFWGYCIFDNHEEVSQDSWEYLRRALLTIVLLVRCLPSLPRSCSRLRYPSLRPREDKIHAPLRISTTSRPCQSWIGDTSGWQRCRGEAQHPIRRH